MKDTKHTAEQIIRKLREADGMLAAGKMSGQAPPGATVFNRRSHGGL